MKTLREYIDWTIELFKKEKQKPAEQTQQVIVKIKPETKKRGRKPKIQPKTTD